MFSRLSFPHRIASCLLLAAVVTLPFGSFAQQTPPPTKELDDPAVELSPFVISATSETGYLATSSLAGTRLKTDLKDIASQIEVLTPEFLNDIGATNLAEVVDYTSNTDGPAQQNIGPNDGVVDGNRLEARARGFDAATQSSDFFATAFPGDFYNVDRVTVANGPQSILFDLGNAGGVLALTTKRALFRNVGSVELRVDDRGSLRTALDANVRLKPDRAALRIAAVDSDALSDLEVLRAKNDGTPLDVGRTPGRHIALTNRLSF